VRLSSGTDAKTTLRAAGFAFRDDAAQALSQLDQAIRRATGCQWETGHYADRIHLNCASVRLCRISFSPVQRG